MKAWQATDRGEPRDVLVLKDVPRPVPGPGQLLVRVLSTPANFPDVLMCRGQYQVVQPLPFTPGMELCGVVVQVGQGVERVELGDRVIGMASGSAGAFAEFALMDAGVTFPAPSALDDAEAASLYVGYQTGWFGLRRRANLQPGEVLLVHAAAGGVGSAAVQLGKALGATVVAVVGGAAKVEVATALGADVVVDRHQQDFVEVVKNVTGARGADVVYDPVGGDAYDRSTKCVAFEGRILLVGFAGGRIQNAALNHALIKNYSIVGLHWGLYQKMERPLVEECHFQLARFAEEGAVRPLVSERFSLPEVPDALQRLADGASVGRLVWSPDADLESRP